MIALQENQIDGNGLSQLRYECKCCYTIQTAMYHMHACTTCPTSCALPAINQHEAVNGHSYPRLTPTST